MVLHTRLELGGLMEILIEVVIGELIKEVE